MKFNQYIQLPAVKRSHPARGAWIEIKNSGEGIIPRRVAPRKGCVD